MPHVVGMIENRQASLHSTRGLSAVIQPPGLLAVGIIDPPFTVEEVPGDVGSGDADGESGITSVTRPAGLSR